MVSSCIIVTPVCGKGSKYIGIEGKAFIYDHVGEANMAVDSLRIFWTPFKSISILITWHIYYIFKMEVAIRVGS